MGLFGFGKKKPATKTKNTNSFGEDMDHLTKDGELPWGWVAYQNDFIKTQEDRINKAYEPIYAARNTSDKLSHFKNYFNEVNSVGEYCKGKGETYYKWFTYHIIESTWYGEQVNKYKQLKADAPKLIEQEKWFEQLEAKIEKKLPDCDGKLQSEFVKTFEHNEQDYVRFYLSRAEKDGRIQRTKSGRSYILNLK